MCVEKFQFRLTLKMKITILLSVLLMGCSTSQYWSLYFQRSKFHERGSDGYKLVLDWMNGHKEAKAYLNTNPQPRVVTVDDRGNVYVYPENRYGYIEFYRTGGESPLMDTFFATYLQDVVYEGWKRHDQLRSAELEKNEIKRRSLVAQAIAKPRAVRFAEIFGIKHDEDFRSVLQRAGFLPHVYGEIEFYQIERTFSDWVNRTEKQIAPGVHPIHGFRFYTFSIRKEDGRIRSIDLMGDEVPAGKPFDNQVREHLNAIKATLHTNGDANYTESETQDHRLIRSWEWQSFPTVDGPMIDVKLWATAGKTAWIFGLSVSDSSNRLNVAAKASKRLDRIRAKKEKTVVKEENMDAPMYALFNKIKDSLVIIKTEKSTGSGFVVKEQTGTYVYTNEHVIRGKGKPTVTNALGNNIELGSFEIAQECDLVRFRISDRHGGLQLLHDVVEIGLPIVGFGNSDGAEVITALNGKIIGVGPNLLEVSAEFVRGNSGSPVLTINGEVVGVATFAVNGNLVQDWVKKDTRFNGVRRFAIKIHDVKWREMNWEDYSIIVNR